MNFITTRIQAYRSKVDVLIGDLHQLTSDIGHAELAKTVSDLRQRIHEPFLFVIAGEVKAGKSSFINALLATGKEICKVAAQPMTDTIQLITYGEQEDVVDVNPYLKKIFQPVEILKEIAIVDTPGTNTIVAHHQEITEGFIPSADLIVFVFESKNPYRQSAWDFFNFIHTDWRRKIIFILQQKDIMLPDDLTTNIQGVTDEAKRRGLIDPVVFAVSARDEQAERFDMSGFSSVRDYIRSNITGGKAPMLKLANNLDTCNNINERIFNGLKIRKEQWNADQDFRKDIRQTLDMQELKSNNQVKMLVENLLAGYDKITNRTVEELGEELSFVQLIKRSVMGIFGSSDTIKERLDKLKVNFEADLNKELREKLQLGVVDVADSIQQMAKLIDLKIKSSKTILKDNHEIFSDIADRRANVLRDLQETFSKFMNRSENFTDESLFKSKGSIAPNIAAGGGIAIVGIILAAVTKGAVMDVTGGILTTVGLLFAGATAVMKRGQILESFRKEIAKGRLQLEEEVAERLAAYVRSIKNKIDLNFTEFDHLLESETVQIKELEERHDALKNRVAMLQNELTNS
ncbi:MAG: dynamin family protein [Saprospiraceae bacterium]|nr:dynamin family protein [Saprospiraceae bacterium]